MKFPNRIAFISEYSFKHTSRLQKQIRSLNKRGYQISLYSGAMNESPHFFQKRQESMVNNPIKYGNIKLISFIRQIKFCVIISKYLIKEKHTVIVCLGLTSLLAGVLAKKKLPKIMLIYDSNELYVERYKGIKKIVWSQIQKRSLVYCDKVIHAEKNRLRYFKNLHRLLDDKMVLLENFPLQKDVSLFKTKKSPENMIHLIYLGNIMPGRGYIELVREFSKLKNNICLDIVGLGKKTFIDKLKLEIVENNCNNIKILPPVQPDKISLLLKDYHIGLMFYENVNLNNYYCAPNKFYEYIDNGLAIISYKYPGMIELIEKKKIGVCIDKITAEILERAIKTIIKNNYFANISPELRLSFTWETQEDKYLSIFK